MDATTLRELQAPLKERYRGDPDAGKVTLRAEGRLGENVSCSVATGRALVEAGLHPATGGSGALACSGDMLLEALVACAGVTMSAVATAIGVEIRSGTLRAEGEIDFRGTLGVSKEVPVGFSSIRLRAELDTPADAEQIATLLRLTERYCVVLQTLRGGVEVETEAGPGRSEAGPRHSEAGPRHSERSEESAVGGQHPAGPADSSLRSE